jgi:hypothetical protein
MRAKFVLIGVPLFILFLSVESARGCSCGGGGAPCLEYGRAAAVFVGTVVDVRDSPQLGRDEARKGEDAGERWEPRAFKFAVEQTFLGLVGAEVEVRTGMGGGDCGYRFEKGETYLVYAYAYGVGKSLTTNICSRTKLFAGAADDLEFLRSVPTRAPGVTISGEVMRRHLNTEGNVKTGGGMAGATLIVEGGGESRKVLTDARGHYTLSGLKAGAYKLRLLIPDELIVWRPEREVNVSDRGCAIVNYIVDDNGRLAGIVTDAEGQPAARIWVRLVDAGDRTLERNSGKATITDEDGRYAFTGVPPGDYVLAVNLTRFPKHEDLTNAFPRTYYPGVAQASEAQVISLGAGESVSGYDLRLPPRRAASFAEVTVVWDDGQPVANAFITFRDVTYHDSGGGNGAEADAQGRFTIKGFAGQLFLVEAGTKQAYAGVVNRERPAERTGPLKIVLANQPESLKVVIKRIR